MLHYDLLNIFKIITRFFPEKSEIKLLFEGTAEQEFYLER